MWLTDAAKRQRDRDRRDRRRSEYVRFRLMSYGTDHYLRMSAQNNLLAEEQGLAHPHPVIGGIVQPYYGMPLDPVERAKHRHHAGLITDAELDEELQQCSQS